jgi:hypothetical protein
MNEEFCLTCVSDHTSYLKFYTKEPGGSGRIYPRLVFTFTVRTVDRHHHIELDELVLRVSSGQPLELLGQGSLSPSETWIRDYDISLQVEVPITREGIQWITDNISGPDVRLNLDFRGTAAIYTASTDATGLVTPIKTVDLVAANHVVSIARSYWFERVLQQIGIGSYIQLEVKVESASLLGDSIQRAMQHLQAAERHYVQGNDPEVLQACYAAYCAIRPNDPQAMFNTIDQRKKEFLDELMIVTKRFTQEGRHIEKAGAMAGSYDVTHADAYFALSQAKIWIAYLSKML